MPAFSTLRLIAANASRGVMRYALRTPPISPILPLRSASTSTLRAPKMLCYQCEQTSAGTGCTTVGVCTKTPQLAGLQDLQMTYCRRLAQLAFIVGPSNPLFREAGSLYLDSIFATLTNVNFDDGRFETYLKDSAQLIAKLEAAVKAAGKALPAPPADLPASLPSTKEGLLEAAKKTGLLARNASVGNDDLFGVVEMATYGLKGVCAYFFHAEHLGGVASGAYSAQDRDQVYQELFRVGDYLARASCVKPANPDAALGEALGECLALGALNVKVMAMLDAAHTKVLGHPVPTEVSTAVAEGRPAILVSGHDMGILHVLLKQCEPEGVDVYTHGEMLPAHSYPNLKKFKNLKGHYGTHWGNQLSEFREFPGTILMTSNCLRPPTRKYNDRIFTCGPVGFHDIPHISGSDYSLVIKKAKSLKPLPVKKSEGGDKKLLIGFGHNAVLGVADKVVAAIKGGALKHVFVIGGCDGTETSRSYFTEIAKSTPKDSIILTLGCGKYRINGTDHGTLGGLPRLLDMGQCNDAYGAVVVATKLAEALGCGIHDLPLHFAVSWFEQKAVAVLLSLLHLNFKNVRIGPAAPAFLTPKVAGILGEKFGLKVIDEINHEEDLKLMLQGQ